MDTKGRRILLRRGGLETTAEVSGTRVAVSAGDWNGSFDIQDLGGGRFEMRGPDGAVLEAISAASGEVVWVGIAGATLDFALVRDAARGRSTTRDQDALSPPMPATVVRIAVKPGDAVSRGDVLVVLEAMKMEMPIKAPRDMVIDAIHCREGELVQPGSALVEGH